MIKKFLWPLSRGGGAKGLSATKKRTFFAASLSGQPKQEGEGGVWGYPPRKKVQKLRRKKNLSKSVSGYFKKKKRKKILLISTPRGRG